MSAAIQTLWAELIAATLADAGATLCVVSPGSRSTPLVAALLGEQRLELATIVDERAAAFFALGAARASGAPVALVCTSGTAAAHYLPAIIEAAYAGVPLVAITADRPPELHDCGASQTIPQHGLYAGFVRAAFDLGPPSDGELGLRAVRRKVIQAIATARGPRPGPTHVNVPLRKPLEPAPPSTKHELALAAFAATLRGRAIVAPPQLAADPQTLRELANAIANEPHGVIVAGAMPIGFARAREQVFALAKRTGYPIVSEAGSQLRFGARPTDVVLVDHFDAIPADEAPVPSLIVQFGAEPVAAAWPAWRANARECWVLAGAGWHDPESSAHAVLLGDVAPAIDAIRSALPAVAGVEARDAWSDTWRTLETAASAALATALDSHPRSETALVRAAIDAVPAGAVIQVGNSLPIRVVDHAGGGGAPRPVITQRGAAGIDGLIASAAGATRAGQPVLLVLGDVSFAHDLGGLLAARAATAPLAILVVDNRGGQIFAGLPIARVLADGSSGPASLGARVLADGSSGPASLGARVLADGSTDDPRATAFDTHWLTPPAIDPAAVASAIGVRAITALSPAAASAAVATALATPGVTVIHAPVSATGARDVRRTAIECFATTAHQMSRRTS